MTEWRVPPCAETGWHKYEHDYVVVVTPAGKLMETANGEIVTELALGQSYAREKGVEHNVVRKLGSDSICLATTYPAGEPVELLGRRRAGPMVG